MRLPLAQDVLELGRLHRHDQVEVTELIHHIENERPRHRHPHDAWVGAQPLHEADENPSVAVGERARKLGGQCGSGHL